MLAGCDVFESSYSELAIVRTRYVDLHWHADHTARVVAVQWLCELTGLAWSGESVSAIFSCVCCQSVEREHNLLESLVSFAINLHKWLSCLFV